MLIEILDIVKEKTGKEVYIKDDVLLYSENDFKVEQPILDKAATILSDYKNQLNDNKKIKESFDYLSSTDFYYIRQQEIGEVVPEEVVTKRKEAREFIRNNNAKIW